jgi:hypothetical protein
VALRLLSMLFVVLGLAGPVLAIGDDGPWTHVTVLQVGGRVHDDVTLAWALDGFLLELAAGDGTVTSLSPDQVDKVKDGLGRDITDAVGEACPATGITYRLLGQGKNVPFVFAVMGDLGCGSAVTTDSGDLSPLLTLVGGARFSVGERLHLRVGYRRQRLVESTLVSGGDIETDADELHLLLGTRMSHPRENNNYSYLEGGVALIRFDQRFADGSGTVPADDLTGVGATLQGGVVLRLSAHLGLDVGGLVMARPGLIVGSTSRNLMFGINTALTLR